LNQHTIQTPNNTPTAKTLNPLFRSEIIHYELSLNLRSSTYESWWSLSVVRRSWSPSWWLSATRRRWVWLFVGMVPIEALYSDEGDKIICAQLYMFSF
jgi:hypothetical protein